MIFFMNFSSMTSLKIFSLIKKNVDKDFFFIEVCCEKKIKNFFKDVDLIFMKKNIDFCLLIIIFTKKN